MEPWMTEADIVRSFKNAAVPGQQIHILAQLNGCEPKIIAAVLKKRGVNINFRTTQRGKVLAMQEQIKKMYRQGFNDLEIAAEIGVHSSSIGLWRKRCSLPVNKRKEGTASVKGGASCQSQYFN